MSKNTLSEKCAAVSFDSKERPNKRGRGKWMKMELPRMKVILQLGGVFLHGAQSKISTPSRSIPSKLSFASSLPLSHMIGCKTLKEQEGLLTKNAKR
jgi:hypothetical protein